MRAFVLFTAGAAMFLAGCSGNGPDENASGNAGRPEDRFVVRAGPVANAQLGALSGTFQMLKSGAPDAIPSGGRGGACIVFDPADLGLTDLASRTCTSNQDCQGGGARAGYCDTGAKACWVRPMADLDGSKTCNRPITMAVADLNPVPRQPVDAGLLEVKAGTKARVVACLNKLGANPGTTGCASINGTDRIEVLGPVTTVR